MRLPWPTPFRDLFHRIPPWGFVAARVRTWLRAPAGPPEARVLEAVIQGSPLPIFALDREGRVQRYWNPAARKHFGFPLSRILGRPMPVLLGGFQEELGRVLDRVFAGEPVADVPGQGMSRNGPSFPVNLSLTPIQGQDRQVILALVTLGDDAPRKARLATLAALLGETSSLLDAVRSAGIVLWAMEPRSGRLVHVSSAAREVVGLGRERLLADPTGLDLLLDPRDRKLFQLALAEALAGHVGSFEALLARPGRRTWTRWTLDLSGARVRGVIQDITEARELQEQLLHSQKLETLGEFLSSITHDFNNILMSILGYNQLLLMDPDLRPEQKQRLEVMRRGASRGQALASRLLRFARKGASEPRNTDINELVSEVLALLQESTAGPITFRAELDPDLPATLAEPSDIHQVIMNLGVNARDALPQGGEIAFRTARVGGEEGLPALGGDHVLVEVRDSGQGIPPEVQERIFDPFFTTKAEGKGTGLGLAVVHRIVSAHGGRVRCLSRQGEGTVFQVFLPVKGERGVSEPPFENQIGTLGD